jgi:hypothetical protein
LHICASSYYRVTVNGDTACHGKIKKAMALYKFETIDISKYTTPGINQIVVECVGYNTKIAEETQKNFIIAEVVAEGETVAATGRNFVSFMDAERVSDCEKRENGEYLEKYQISGATMVKMTAQKVDIGPMHFMGEKREYDYAYKNAPLCAEKGIFSVNDEKISYNKVYGKTKYPITLKTGEYALFDMEEKVKGFIRMAFKTFDKANLFILGSKDNVVFENLMELEVIDGEFDRESFHTSEIKYLKVLVTQGEAEVHLMGMHQIK